MSTAKRLFLLFIVAAIFVRGSDSGSDRIFSAAELATLDRENEMWRTLRVDENVGQCVQRLRENGFSELEITLLRPKIDAIWTVELERNFGWLSKEAIGKIQEVDKKFMPRLRAVRLYGAIGIRKFAGKEEKMNELSREWQRAIQRELDFREITEFRLVNSSSAQLVARLTKGITLTTDEFRVLCEWQRDFDGQHRANSGFSNPSDRRVIVEDKFDLYSRIRSLLGDARFAVYLAQAETDFERMNEALASVDHLSPGLTLDLWWVKQKREIARASTKEPVELKKINERTRQSAESLLGQERFAQYSVDETSRWLK